jgi:NADPH:quinone reductase-like Zn-dependent oxidoreductase
MFLLRPITDNAEVPERSRPEPISGAYAEFVCLPQSELVPVPAGLNAAEAVSLVPNHITAYQMLRRSVHPKTLEQRAKRRRADLSGTTT